MIGQLDPGVMRSPSGEWSLVGVLVVGCTGVLSALIFLFHRLESGRIEEIRDLKKKLIELEERNRICYEDRLKIHAELLALKREVELLKAAK